MRVGPLGIWEIMIILANVGLPAYVTLLVFTSKGHSTTNRLLFLLIIWLIPLLGPLAALFLLRKPAEGSRLSSWLSLLPRVRQLNLGSLRAYYAPLNNKAPKLRSGDTVGVLSPSWGGAGAFPHRVEAAKRQLESLGFRVKVAEHALNKESFSDTAAERVKDIHNLFRDPEVKAIVAASGGDHSCHLLPHLDFELIAEHPKVFIGYSDVTVLNVAIWVKTGLTTFNGPALVTDVAARPATLYTERYFLKATTLAEPLGVIEPALEWTEAFLGWEAKQDLEQPRAPQASPGWTWLKEGKATGRLLGGCLESLQHLRGTPYWPNWDGAIFFFDISKATPSPETVDAILMDYENMGVLERLRGLLVGRPIYYSDDEKRRLDERLLERAEKYAFPIVTNMDFGRTAPQFTLPLGCLARIDSEEKRFEVLEAAVV